MWCDILLCCLLSFLPLALLNTHLHWCFSLVLFMGTVHWYMYFSWVLFMGTVHWYCQWSRLLMWVPMVLQWKKEAHEKFFRLKALRSIHDELITQHGFPDACPSHAEMVLCEPSKHELQVRQC